MLPVTLTTPQVATPRAGLPLALAVVITACTPQPTVPPPPPKQPLESQALEAVQANNPRLAAERYELLAEQSTGEPRVTYLLAASRQRIAANELATASRWLELAAIDASPNQRLELNVLQAELPCGVSSRNWRCDTSRSCPIRRRTRFGLKHWVYRGGLSWPSDGSWLGLQPWPNGKHGWCDPRLC